MSRIYFHSPSGDKEIYGRERAHMGCLTEDVARGLIVSRFNALDLAPFLPPGAFPLKELEPRLGSAPRFADSLGLWVRGSHPPSVWVVEESEYDCWQLSLNTCLVIGNDAMKLCARLHAQCEIHAYVEGPNRAWLAGIVKKGIVCGLMRDGGSEHERGQWTRLADWLASRDDEPVVTSYSVCEQFPNGTVAEWEDDQDGDRWYSLPAEKRWEMALAKLREQNHGLELTSEGWEEYRFGHCKDAFWLWEQVRAARAVTA